MEYEILTLLKNAEDYISGEYISTNLNVSRTAIWKHINNLKKKGYIIEGISNKGYKLISEPDLLTANSVIPNLKTKIIGRNILHFDSINSTNIKAKELREGGSTITQQLAKNIYFTQEKSALRKIAEIFMAYDLEKNLNKDTILELYLNTSYFGDGYYCVNDASEGYYGKEPKDMNRNEASMLAGIPNAPSAYCPTKHLNLAKQRQIQVLDKMIKYKFITEQDKTEILNEKNEVCQ